MKKFMIYFKKSQFEKDYKNAFIYLILKNHRF